MKFVNDFANCEYSKKFTMADGKDSLPAIFSESPVSGDLYIDFSDPTVEDIYPMLLVMSSTLDGGLHRDSLSFTVTILASPCTKAFNFPPLPYPFSS